MDPAASRRVSNEGLRRPSWSPPGPAISPGFVAGISLIRRISRARKRSVTARYDPIWHGHERRSRLVPMERVGSWTGVRSMVGRVRGATAMVSPSCDPDPGRGRVSNPQSQAHPGRGVVRHGHGVDADRWSGAADRIARSAARTRSASRCGHRRCRWCRLLRHPHPHAHAIRASGPDHGSVRHHAPGCLAVAGCPGEPGPIRERAAPRPVRCPGDQRERTDVPAHSRASAGSHTPTHGPTGT